MKSPEEVLIEMIYAIDTNQWELAKEQFSPEVFVDYQSMSGNPGSAVKSEDLVNGWEKLLTKVDTHHMLSNFESQIEGSVAKVRSYVYACHSAKGLEHWDIFGIYYHELIKGESGWKISAMKLVVHGQRGNVDFLQEVTEI